MTDLAQEFATVRDEILAGGGCHAALDAIEARVQELEREIEWFRNERVSDTNIFAALRARVERLEGVLRPFAKMYNERDGQEMFADTCTVSWVYDMYGTQELTCGDLRLAAAALAEGNP